MLVLVSFGLVLLATILLVVGVLSDNGLTFIHISIAASATAAIVLYVAFYKAKPKAEPTATAPAPLPEPVAVAAAPAAAAAAPKAKPPVAAPVPAAIVEDEDEDFDDEVADDEAWDEFPIADYDDLKVGEIMPLLPQLYSDELPAVAEREAAGKNRSTILRRIEELAAGGTIDNPVEDDEDWDEDEEWAAEEEADDTEAIPVVAADETEAPVSLADDDDEWDADEDFFPIADYDDLTVAQIMPLVPELFDDELQDVRDREASGKARATVLDALDERLGVKPAAKKTPAKKKKSTTKKAAATKAPARKKSAAKKSAAKKTAAKKTAAKRAPAKSKSAPAKKRAAATSAPAKKRTAKKAAKKKSTRFPIANYDDLTVADIRPRLTDLSDNQLGQVRKREMAGAGRKTILDDIDGRLN